MIDASEVKALAKAAGCKLAYVEKDGVGIVHCRVLLLERPLAEIEPIEWPGKPLEGVRQWRFTQVPQDAEPEPAQILTDTWGGREVKLLMSDNVYLGMQVPVYDFVRQAVEGAEFRLFTGNRPDGSPWPIGVYVEGKLSGLVAPLVQDPNSEWDMLPLEE